MGKELGDMLYDRHSEKTKLGGLGKVLPIIWAYAVAELPGWMKFKCLKALEVTGSASSKTYSQFGLDSTRDAL